LFELVRKDNSEKGAGVLPKEKRVIGRRSGIAELGEGEIPSQPGGSGRNHGERSTQCSRVKGKKKIDRKICGSAG